MTKLMLLFVLPVLVAALAVGGLKVTPDKENVVASRLIGSWEIDDSLYERLWGSPVGDKHKTLTFRSDAAVAESVPEKVVEFLSGRTIYMAGYVKQGEKDEPFLLTDYHGNPYIFTFRERNGDPFGDTESSNLMLAPAKDPKDDLLLMGGDFNNQPFQPYRRVQEGPK